MDMLLVFHADQKPEDHSVDAFAEIPVPVSVLIPPFPHQNSPVRIRDVVSVQPAAAMKQPSVQQFGKVKILIIITMTKGCSFLPIVPPSVRYGILSIF